MSGVRSWEKQKALEKKAVMLLRQKWLADIADKYEGVTSASRAVGMDRSAFHRAALQAGVKFSTDNNRMDSRTKVKVLSLLKTHMKASDIAAECGVSYRQVVLVARNAGFTSVSTLRHMSPEDKVDYDFLVKNGFSRADAFASVGYFDTS